MPPKVPIGLSFVIKFTFEILPNDSPKGKITLNPKSKLNIQLSWGIKEVKK